MQLHLISFDICPFVQRSVITLIEKGMDYDITYLTLDELNNPPGWFSDISPFGRVPVLRVDDVSVFESAVINEYLDEIKSPFLQPTEPLTRALNRSWIRFAEDLLFSQYYYSIAEDEAAFSQHQKDIHTRMEQLEAILSDGPFFNGDEFALIDTSFAPFFMRMELLENAHSGNFYQNRPKLQKWRDACLAKKSVGASVVENFEGLYLDYIANSNGFGAELFGRKQHATA